MNTSTSYGDASRILPEDGVRGTLVSRIWNPAVGGPSPVVLREDGVYDISGSFATVRDLLENDEPARAARVAPGECVGAIEDVLAASAPETRSPVNIHFLSPIDLQVVKAAGVTFAVSMIERVIEERSLGDAANALRIRETMVANIGNDFAAVVPGSAEAAKVKQVLIDEGLWSQYLEVGIGPDAETFTKAPTLATVGFGSPVGIYSGSTWNNPEPEVVLAVTSTGRIVGATLGNDVNLRDIEGRSALLLSKAKDNNASGSLGPWIRLFDDTFSLDDVRTMKVGLAITGPDGFVLEDASDMSKISRDPEDIVRQLIGRHHQYPDGAVLYLGTLFAPTKDRDTEGAGFTHKIGDVVRISSPQLGSLINEVRFSEDCDPWVFGLRELMTNLSQRRLL